MFTILVHPWGFLCLNLHLPQPRGKSIRISYRAIARPAIEWGGHHGQRVQDMAAQLLCGVSAGIVGLGSVTLYLAAFFFPEVHRRHDFFWSGVGCFYALVLWLDADQITPTELVGHLASISLMGWLGWQTLTLRRKRTPLAQQTPYTADSWPTFRREMADLALEALRQTPLRRWLPDPASAPIQGPGMRVSALKDVGYEFVDSVEPPEATVSSRRPGSPGTEPQPPRQPARSNPARAVPAPSPPAPSIQSPSMQTAGVQSPAAPSAEKRPGVALAPPPRAKGITWSQRVQGLITWGQEVVQSKTTPKPKKPVIEIPPRPSSLAKRAPAPSPSPPDSAAVKPTAVQPPPEPMPPAEPPAGSPAPSDATFVAPEARSETNTPSTPGAAPSTRPSQDGLEASNWDDEDEDWI